MMIAVTELNYEIIPSSECEGAGKFKFLETKPRKLVVSWVANHCQTRLALSYGVIQVRSRNEDHPTNQIHGAGIPPAMLLVLNDTSFVPPKSPYNFHSTQSYYI